MSRRKKPATPKRLAIDIAQYLFVNGVGEKAERLVLTSTDGRDLGGWGFSSVVHAVNRILEDGLLVGKPVPAKVKK